MFNDTTGGHREDRIPQNVGNYQITKQILQQVSCKRTEGGVSGQVSEFCVILWWLVHV